MNSLYSYCLRNIDPSLFPEWMERFGWEESEKRGKNAESMSVKLVYGQPSLIVIELSEIPLANLLRGFQREHRIPSELRTVMCHGSQEKDTFQIEVNAVGLDADGNERSLETEPIHSDNRGDAGEMMEDVFLEFAFSEVKVDHETLLYITRQIGEYSVRFRSIADAILMNPVFEVNEFHGQKLISFTWPDGTNQKSALTQNELEELYRLVGR